VTVEFVALMPAFLFLTFFVFEIMVAVLWVGTVEKAVQLGARLAIVSNYAVTGLAPNQKNAVAAGYVPGAHCSQGGCVGFTVRTCSGGSIGDCNAANFNVLVNRMRSIAGLIQPQNVTITYDYIGLGFAGGPIIPRVTLTVQNVPYGAVVTTIMATFFRAATGNPSAISPLTNLPTVTATFTGEDLNTAGAS